MGGCRSGEGVGVGRVVRWTYRNGIILTKSVGHNVPIDQDEIMSHNFKTNVINLPSMVSFTSGKGDVWLITCHIALSWWPVCGRSVHSHILLCKGWLVGSNVRTYATTEHGSCVPFHNSSLTSLVSKYDLIWLSTCSSYLIEFICLRTGMCDGKHFNQHLVTSPLRLLPDGPQTHATVTLHLHISILWPNNLTPLW